MYGGEWGEISVGVVEGGVEKIFRSVCVWGGDVGGEGVRERFRVVGGFGRERRVLRISVFGVVCVDVCGVEEWFGWDVWVV